MKKIVLILLFSGCGALSSETKQTLNDVVNCTTETAKKEITQYAPVLDMSISRAIDAAGKIDRTAIKDITKNFVTNSGGCVLAASISRMLNHVRDPNAPQSEDLVVDKADLLATFNEIRAAQLKGATFKTEEGTL